MKIKVLLLAVAGCSLMSGAYAQKGIDNGTPFGSGEDSVRCVKNISLFVPYAKSGDFKDAEPFWKQAYAECPGAHTDIYLYGVKIMNWKIANEKDATKRQALINDLMKLYDTRVKYFSDYTNRGKNYGKDWIISRKANDYMTLMGDKTDYNIMYGWLDEVVKESGDNTESLGISLYMYASQVLLNKDPQHKEKYIADYLKCDSILARQLEAATTANDPKAIAAIGSYKTNVEVGFANSGAADCETLQKMYGPEIDAHKADSTYLKKTMSLLRRMKCQETDAYMAASDYIYIIKPTADAALGKAKRAVRAKDYDTAAKYYEEAAKLEDDPDAKAEDYYSLGVLAFDDHNYSRARAYCMRAIETKGNYGAPYILIANMYAATANSIYPDDKILAKCVFYAAIDKLERAKAVDSSVAGEANRYIASYRSHLPNAEELFMDPNLKKGTRITIGGWIGESTTIR